MHDSGNVFIPVPIPIPAFLRFLVPVVIPVKNPWFRFQHNLIFLIPIPIPAKNTVIPEPIPESESCITDARQTGVS